MNKYTALTIGPMYQTFSLAKKTREIWAGSFMFSMLMRKIIKQIEGDTERKENIQIPYANNYPELDGATGLYSDRLLYKGEIGNLETIINESVTELAGLMVKKETDLEKMKNFLMEYLQIYHFTTNEEELSKVPGDNYIAQMDFVLNSLELESKVHIAKNIRKTGTFMKYLPKTKLYNEYFLKTHTTGTKSLVEIATYELSCSQLYQESYNQLRDKYIKIQEKDSEEATFVEDDNEFVGKLSERIKDIIKKEKEANQSIDRLPEFKNYHKYAAVIYSDGDKMGKLVGKAIELGLDIHKISNALFEWAAEASKIIDDFGGLPVYAGGDDLLCFTPIVSGDKTIVTELKKISRIFTKEFKTALGEKLPKDYTFPTLSFGVAITYYKFPLNESLKIAHNLLYEMKDGGGNGIRMKMLKHSGSDFDFTLPFYEGEEGKKGGKEENEVLSIFNSLMKAEMTESMLSSTAYHLQNNVKVIDEIASDEVRIHNFFINKMEGYPKDDDDKKNDNKEHYLKQVERLVNHEFKKAKTDKDGNYVNRMLPVYDMLRIVKFFKGLDITD